MPPKVTLRDIATAAGVSTYTVSKALNDGKGVSEKSRTHVLAVARELGYVANLAAQELRGAARSSVAVITAGTANAYYVDMMNGIQRVVQDANQSVVLMDITINGAYDADLEDRTVQRLLEARMAGVITTLTLKPASIERLAKWDIPVVFVDSSPPEGMEYLPSVTTDNYDASLKVGAHLAELGHQDWLFLVYPGIWSSRKDREAGLLEAARRAGASIEVVESANNAQSAKETLDQALEARGTRPDVLIAGNNPLLLGILNCLRERDLQAPGDIAVVSYDDFAWAPFIEPPITVLDERSEEIGTRAAQTLVKIIGEQIADGSSSMPAAPNYREDLKQQVPVGLIVRRSCGCATPPDPKA
ncbi:LacI family transcriptional regulator [Thioclava sp. NG1]|uniref:LacI family DNA-binding transcriptional regulator n=1 Tax=Thioclava sp. NG1 TaxID=2182426 RepID=UPI000D61474C|nr:LacI family DNA-binding transcriptional regulator [Thioclava sp. NG1]PWE50773.1 LacI family transcriptional regulator [Thioclava sp. NG1]